MVFDHRGDYASQHEAIRSIASKIGCSGETPRNWVRQAERDHGLRPGPTSEESERIKARERQVGELRQANEILRKASEHFAQGPSRRMTSIRLPGKESSTARSSDEGVHRRAS